MAISITDNDKSRKAKTPSTLDNFGVTVDMNDPIGQF